MGNLQEIPPIEGIAEPVARILRALKARVEAMSGRRGREIQRLGPAATDTDRNNKINELIDLLNR